MNFKKFIATKRIYLEHQEDILIDEGIYVEDFEGCLGKMIYMDKFYIDIDMNGKYNLILDRDIIVRDDLGELEPMLYDFAKEEGYFDAEGIELNVEHLYEGVNYIKRLVDNKDCSWKMVEAIDLLRENLMLMKEEIK